jgi:hypothetical protein
MFGRKEKHALEQLPPLHSQLVTEHQLSVAQTPAQWLELFTSLQTNQQVVHKHPLPPRTVDFLIPLLRVLTEDVPDVGYLGLRLDLRGSGAAGKEGPSQELPVAKPVRKCVQHYEFDPWLSLEARLNDRSKLDLWVADVVRVRRVTKKSSSGKIKTKTKKKGTQRVRVRLSVRADRDVSAPAQGMPNWCRITMSRDERHIVLDGRAKYPIEMPRPVVSGVAAFLTPNLPSSVGPPAAGQLNNVLLLLGEVFRWVQPAVGERSSA